MSGYHAIFIHVNSGVTVRADSSGNIYTKGEAFPALMQTIKQHKSQAPEAISMLPGLNTTLILKTETGLRIAFLLEQKGIQQKDFAREIGVTDIHLSKVIHGENGVTFKRLEDICTALNISLAEFFSTFSGDKSAFPLYAKSLIAKIEKLSIDDIHILEDIVDGLNKLNRTNTINMDEAHVSGSAAAGRPLCDEADADSSVAVPRKYCDSSRYLIFQARGDSTVPRIPDGSYVVIQRDAPPEDGDIAVVRVASSGDDEYAIKRFYRRGDRVELRSFNPAYAPMIYPADDVQSADRVVAFLPVPSAQ